MRKSPALAVDIFIIFPDKSFILIKRSKPPFKDHWALPGGFVEYGETVENAAIREAEEETGLKVKLIKLIGVYSKPDRDPRGHVVSIAFIAKPIGGQIKVTDEAKEIKLFKEIPEKMAFDHAEIIK
ncbi:MAG: NUDIX hydrolase, partial [Candidatus Methanomethylicota archaeon]